VVEDSEGRFCGAVVGYEKGAVTLEDRHGKRRVFPLAPAAFLLEGQPVTLVTPAPAAPSAPAKSTLTASGSVAAPAAERARAKVARASRIYVEGKHDAELVEKIWGTTCATSASWWSTWKASTTCPPSSGASPPLRRRLGVLVDHLVAGSKETKIAASVRSPDVLIVGHPFIDIWAAVRPSAVGIAAWPMSRAGSRGRKACCAPSAGRGGARGLAAHPALGEQLADLEPELLGRVEELIDFVTTPGSA
jgi:Protein of unknown function (DUF3097).